MVFYNRLIQVDFPSMPQRLLGFNKLRKHMVCSSAYVKFALKEADIEYEPDLTAALVTDSTHDLEQDLEPIEYINASLGELSLAEDEIENIINKLDEDDQDKIKDLKYLKEELHYTYENINNTL